MAYKLVDHYRFEWTSPRDGSVVIFEIKTYRDEYPYEAPPNWRGKSVLYPSMERFFGYIPSQSEDLAIHEMKVNWGLMGGTWKTFSIL